MYTDATIEVMKQLIIKLTALVTILTAQLAAQQAVAPTVIQPTGTGSGSGVAVVVAKTNAELYQEYREEFMAVTPYQVDSCWAELKSRYIGEPPSDFPGYYDCIDPTNTKYKTPEQMEAYAKLKELEAIGL